MKRYYVMSGDTDIIELCKDAKDALELRDCYNSHLTAREFEDHAYIACYGEWDDEEDGPDLMAGYDPVPEETELSNSENPNSLKGTAPAAPVTQKKGNNPPKKIKELLCADYAKLRINKFAVLNRRMYGPCDEKVDKLELDMSIMGKYDYHFAIVSRDADGVVDEVAQCMERAFADAAQTYSRNLKNGYISADVELKS